MCARIHCKSHGLQYPVCIQIEHHIHPDVAKNLISPMLTFRSHFNEDPATAAQLFGGLVGLQYIPEACRSRIDSEFFYQWIVILGFIDQTLEKIVPSADEIRRTAGSGLEHFYSKGGRVEYAIDYLLSALMRDRPFDDPANDLMQSQPGWNDLPRCVNDTEIQMVRNRMGLVPNKIWGPYESEKAQFHVLRV